MRSLSNLGITPPGGFRFFCEETKSWIPATGHMVSYTDFIYACRKHSIANNLPIGSQWEQQIQAQICATLDGEWCSEGGYPVPPRGGWGFTVDQVVQNSHRIAERMIAARARRVPTVESTARTVVCLACPMNQAPEGCSNCSIASINSAANLVDGAGSILHDARLKSCKVSGFSLKAKIHVPSDILLELLTDSQMNALPTACWLK